jgi:hypothetical protein
VALALVCALLAASAAALLCGSGTALAAGSGGGPLSPGLSTPGTPTPTTATQAQTQATGTTTTAGGGGGSLSQTSVLAIVVGAVIVIGGVCLYIFRDARRRAPSRGRRADGGTGGSTSQPRVPGSQRVKARKLSPQERKRRRRGRAPRRK